jgi:tyrosine-protein phosphatase YwqE
MVPAEIVSRALSDVVHAGLVPILAHPERYSSCSVEAVTAWREIGSVIQVDATTMTLARRRGERARALVTAGLADILGADNHGDARNVATARDWLCERGGEEQATLLLDTNPRAILDDTSVYEVDPLKSRMSLWRSVRRMFGSA